MAESPWSLDGKAWEGSGQPLQWFWLMHPEAPVGNREERGSFESRFLRYLSESENGHLNKAGKYMVNYGDFNHDIPKDQIYQI